jgi:hypothetical protein
VTFHELIFHFTWSRRYEWAEGYSSNYQVFTFVVAPFLEQKTLLLMLAVQFDNGRALS